MFSNTAHEKDKLSYPSSELTIDNIVKIFVYVERFKKVKSMNGSMFRNFFNRWKSKVWFISRQSLITGHFHIYEQISTSLALTMVSYSSLLLI